VTCSGGLRALAEKIARTVTDVFSIDNRITSVPTRGSTLLTG
jgi:hypothetical protein